MNGKQHSSLLDRASPGYRDAVLDAESAARRQLAVTRVLAAAVSAVSWQSERMVVVDMTHDAGAMLRSVISIGLAAELHTALGEVLRAEARAGRPRTLSAIDDDSGDQVVTEPTALTSPCKRVTDTATTQGRRSGRRQATANPDSLERPRQ